MKILHVASGLQKASGVTTFVENLVAELRALGHEVDIATRASLATTHNPPITNNQQPTTNHYDIVHLHGIWEPCVNRVARMAYRAGVPVVWSPHGMLQKWALKNKWWKKIAALTLFQWWNLRRAALLHVTAESEVEDVRRLWLKNNLVIAPLGVRVDKMRKEVDRVAERRTLLFVSRVQRKKGLPNLLEAWAKIPEDLKKNWAIRIVGPDQDGHTAELMSLCERLGLSYTDQNSNLHCPPPFSTSTSSPTSSLASFRPQVEFVGPKYGEELSAEYGAADLFVLPTHSENFGSVVVEALARSVPVVCTKGAPWEELETNQCGWWCDDSVDALRAALHEAMVMTDEERREMGERGRKLVEEKYTWEAVARAMVKGYEEVVG